LPLRVFYPVLFRIRWKQLANFCSRPFCSWTQSSLLFPKIRAAIANASEFIWSFFSLGLAFTKVASRCVRSYKHLTA
jgi:hypothetical protein